MDQPHPVAYERRGRAAWLIIDRPDQRNAMNDAVIEGLITGLSDAGRDAAVRVVVLTGRGDRAFCSGADLTSTMAPGGGGVSAHDRRGRLADLLVAMGRHPQPVIGRANGAALAGGFGLLLACDLVVAADDAILGTPEINLGLWPYMVSALIIRNVPRKIAMEMMLTGRRFTSAEAERWGMVNRVVSRDLLDHTIEELVAELASKSPLILRMGKETLFRAQDMGLEEALRYLQAMLTVNLESEDVAEGVSAFLEKRSPEWRGR